MRGHAGAGVYCQDFAHYIQICAEGKAFKGEAKVIEVVLLNLIQGFVTSTKQ